MATVNSLHGDFPAVAGFSVRGDLQPSGPEEKICDGFGNVSEPEIPFSVYELNINDLGVGQQVEAGSPDCGPNQSVFIDAESGEQACVDDRVDLGLPFLDEEDDAFTFDGTLVSTQPHELETEPRTYELRLSNCDDSLGSSCTYTVEVDPATNEIIIHIDENVESQLTIQDLQFIELVLARDVYNPLWVFALQRLGSEIEYEMHPGNLYPGVLDPMSFMGLQSGGDRGQDGFLLLKTTEDLGDTVAVSLSVQNSGGGLISSKGEDYPPVQANLVMRKIGQDPRNQFVTLYAPEEKPYIIASVTTTTDTLQAILGSQPNPVNENNTLILQGIDGANLHVSVCGGCPETDIPEGMIETSLTLPIQAVDIELEVLDASGDIVATNNQFVIRWQRGSNSAIAEPTDRYRLKVVSTDPDLEYRVTKWDAAVSSLGRKFVKTEGTPTDNDDKCTNVVDEDEVLGPKLVGVPAPTNTSAVFRIPEPDSGSGLPPKYDSGCGTAGNGKKAQSKPYQLEVMVEGEVIKDGEAQSFRYERTFAQDLKAIIVQEYWDHYPYKNGRGAYLECVSAAAMVNTTNQKECGQGNSYEIPTVEDFVPAVYTDTYTEIGTWNNCDYSCAEMISANYQSAGLTILGSGFTFIDSVNLEWRNQMETWYESHPLVEPGYSSGTPYVAWVQSIWRNPERQEANNDVINSAHQFGVGVDFSHKNAFEDDIRPPFSYNEDGTVNDRASTAICLLAASAWAVGGIEQTLIENVRSGTGGPVFYIWDGNSDIASCIVAVNQKTIDCLTIPDDVSDPMNAPEARFNTCTPTHVHSARPND